MIVALAMAAPHLMAMGGTPPAGLPSYFGFGCDDKFDSFAPNGPHKWKVGQSCFDYSYVYIVPGWRTYKAPDYSWAQQELQGWEGNGEYQVFTYYYSYGDKNFFTSTTNMNGYWLDLANLLQVINTYSTKKAIIHFEPDGIGFWRNSSTSVTAVGTVQVGSCAPGGIFPATVDGLAWNTTNFPNTLQGWSKAIYHLRNHFAASKVLLAHHYTHWATGQDVFVTPNNAGSVDAAVKDMTDYIQSIENGLPFDLFFADPADRDADFWNNHACGTPANNSRWDEASYSMTWGTRSWASEAYVVNDVSTNLSRRGFMWQVPVGNTYMKTCNNSNGHFRDNRVQGFMPSSSYNGASGNPGDAYSSASTAAGPGFWAQHGIIGVLFGSGGYDTTPSPCNGGGDLLTHQRDRMLDSSVPGSDANAGYAGALYSTWGQHAPANATDDDGGYLRAAVAQYCVVGKYPLGAVPTATRTPTPCVCSPTFTPTSTVTPADCAVMLNDAESAGSNGLWSGVNATRSWVSSPAAAVSQGTNAMLVTINTATGTFNGAIANLGGFAPQNWAGYTRMTMDVYVDPAAFPWTAASSYHQIALQAAAASIAKYQQDITSGPLAVSTGMNHLDFALTYPGGAAGIQPGDPMSDIFIAVSAQAVATGKIYIDNVVLHSDAACPPPSPTSTATRSRTPTASPSSTKTVTPSSTVTQSATPSRTPSSTPSVSTTLTGTPAQSPTFTATPSLTRTPTSSASPSSTPSSSPSQTSSRTATPSQTVTMSATPTFTVQAGSPTSTPTSSHTATATATATSSATSSATPSRSPTWTATPSQTLSIYSPTDSPTWTATPSRTPSFTATPTLTATRSATASTTPSVTLSNTPLPGSPTDSPTPTPLVSPTASPTSTLSGTISPSFTTTPSSSPTPSSTATRSSTASATATPTSSPTGTPSPSASASPTPSGTLTQSASPTVSATLTQSATASFSPTQTLSFTASHTPLPASPTSTFTATRTATPTSTPAPILPTATAQPNGPNQIDHHAAAPNPNPGAGYVALHLLGGVDSVELKVFTKSMTCLGISRLGAQGPGWCKVPLPSELNGQSSGLYYYRVKSKRSGTENSEPGIGSFMVIR